VAKGVARVGDWRPPSRGSTWRTGQ